MSELPDVDVVAASLRADSADLAMFLEVLAGKLVDALPGLTTVDTSGGRFGRPRRVERLSVDLGDQRLTLARSGAALTGEIAHQVRGVRLSGEQVDVDTWLRALATLLTTRAAAESRSREALARILG